MAQHHGTAPPRPQDSAALTVGRRRLKLVALAFAVAFASIGLRLVDMVEPHPPSGMTATRPQPAAHSDEPEVATTGRADIVDRNGVVLATTIRVPGVHADPSLLADKAAAARQLAAILGGVDAADLHRRFEGGRRFAWVKHRITPEEQQAVLDLGLPGVSFSSAEHRVYPKERLTSHVTGFVDIDNHGRSGMERALDARLRGSAEPAALSLDVRVQQIAREELLRAYDRFRAVGGNALVLDVASGELLAMVSLPDFDPNRVGDVRRIEYLNRNTGEVYELGSVFKILTIAMALDSGRVSLADRFDATGKLQIGRHRIGDDHAKNRWLSVAEIFQYSSNIGTARMAIAAGGAAPLEEFFRKIGLYAPPRIELAEVVKPRTPKRWAEVTVATTSFGHGFAVTPLQFVDAVAGIVGNGGRVPPTLLKREVGVQLPRTRFVQEHTAEILRWLMWLAVERGTGDRARLPSYLVGGKTGTAEKPVKGGYSTDRVLASFVGAFPIQEPRYLVFAALDEPQGDAGTYGYRYGGWTAAPVVAAIIDRIGPLLGVPPTPPEIEHAMRERLEREAPIAAGDDDHHPRPTSGRQEARLALGSALR
jgi:cell division protein FtsI (penicillin-binding protein 3)